MRKEDVFGTPLRFVGINLEENEDDEPRIRINQTDAEGNTKTILKKDLENLRAKRENNKKFSNLRIIVRESVGIETDDYKDVEIPFDKINISSNASNNNQDETSIKVAAEQLMLYLDAGLPIIYIDTFEEDKADEIINSVASERDIYEWNNAEGLFKRNRAGDYVANFDNRMSLKDTLQFFIDSSRSSQYGTGIKSQLKDSVLILKDAHKYFEDESIVAQVKYLAQLIYTGALDDCTVIIVSSVLKIPPVLEHYLIILKIDNLNENELEELIYSFCEKHNANKPSPLLVKKLVTAFKGMSEFDITNILSLALASENDLTFSDLDLIIDNKKQIVRKTKILDMVECDEDKDDIGGLEHLKEWLEKKENTFHYIDEAIQCGVRIPKGILIVGMPGCGKTLTAKATAAIFDLPLLKLDMGRILGKYVGESEKNMHRATALAEATAPCVLWIDELEKAFAGTGGDGGGEITVRLLGLFLTWMQEKIAPVFVVATANSVDRLPPELLRRGRFDEIFYVGTPNAAERKAIFKIHIDKVLHNDNFICDENELQLDEKLNQLARDTLGCSGADIAAIVSDAVERSFSDHISDKKKKKHSSAKKTITEEKPNFSIDLVQEIVDNSAKVSAWNQLSRMFANYKSKKFKSASKADFSDISYWINLRLKYLVTSPRRTLNVMGAIIQRTRALLHEHGRKRNEQWKSEEELIEQKKAPKLVWYRRFCRKVARGFYKIIDPNKKVESQSKLNIELEDKPKIEPKTEQKD